MARRNFVVELDDLIRARSVEGNLRRRAPSSERVEDAGFIQGLNAAKLLYEEILQAALKDED